MVGSFYVNAAYLTLLPYHLQATTATKKQRKLENTRNILERTSEFSF